MFGTILNPALPAQTTSAYQYALQLNSLTCVEVSFAHMIHAVSIKGDAKLGMG